MAELDSRVALPEVFRKTSLSEYGDSEAIGPEPRPKVVSGKIEELAPPSGQFPLLSTCPNAPTASAPAVTATTHRLSAADDSLSKGSTCLPLDRGTSIPARESGPIPGIGVSNASAAAPAVDDVDICASDSASNIFFVITLIRRHHIYPVVPVFAPLLHLLCCVMSGS